MIHLTELVFLLKKSRKSIALGVVAFIALIFILNSWNAIINALIPPKPPPETVAFGILSVYDLSDGFKPKSSVEFRLQAITGNFPVLPTKAKVFETAKKIPSFAAEESIKERARKLGFIKEPVKISGSVMEFGSSNQENKNLIYDTLTLNYVMSFKLEPSLIMTRPSSIDSSMGTASNFFESMGLDFNQYPKSKVITKTLKFENNSIVEANSLSNADLIEVAFNLTDIEELPTIFVKKGSTSIYALVANSRVIYAKEESPDVELFRFATYPLKSINQAWEELNSGKSYFNIENLNSTVDIKDVKLGYVMGSKNNQYIQPVYLFLGEGDFRAFIPAVADAWIGKEN
jgi:hypothetical protein